jgi:DUF4097 and DUF4098 domain-containing protein YvlB
LVVRADFGSISVRQGSPGRVDCRVRLRAFTGSEVEARRILKSYELTLREEKGSLLLKGGFVSDRQGRKALEATFDLAVPPRFHLDAQTKGGSIQVQKLEGELRAVTAGGEIRAEDVTGSVRAETAGGSISLGNVAGAVEARTAGGSIRVGDVKGSAVLETSGGEIIAGRVEGALRAETAGGDLILHGATGPLEAQTAGGQITLGETGSSVRAQTAGGSIRLRGARGWVKVETAGGSLDLLQLRSAVQASTAAGCIVAQIAEEQKSFGASQLETALGDIRVYLPPNLPLTIDAAIDAARGHTIVSEFPLQIQSGGERFAPSTVRGHGSLNGGGETLRLRTVAGNIEIRKLDARTLEQLRAQQDSFWKRWQAQEERRPQY